MTEQTESKLTLDEVIKLCDNVGEWDGLQFYNRISYYGRLKQDEGFGIGITVDREPYSPNFLSFINPRRFPKNIYTIEIKCDMVEVGMYDSIDHPEIKDVFTLAEKSALKRKNELIKLTSKKAKQME